MIFKSIKWRLQAWHGLLLVCVLGDLVHVGSPSDR